MGCCSAFLRTCELPEEKLLRKLLCETNNKSGDLLVCLSFTDALRHTCAIVSIVNVRWIDDVHRGAEEFWWDEGRRVKQFSSQLICYLARFVLTVTSFSGCTLRCDASLYVGWDPRASLEAQNGPIQSITNLIRPGTDIDLLCVFTFTCGCSFTISWCNIWHGSISVYDLAIRLFFICFDTWSNRSNNSIFYNRWNSKLGFRRCEFNVV